MKVEDFLKIINCKFYTGVPDSQLKPLCNYLVDEYGVNTQQHIVAANEGNSVALAAGYYLATGETPLVYMQNSGEGNAINPLASLLNEKVYAIPCVLVIGWRGKPGTADEPQHEFQGEITCGLLETMNIPYTVLSKDTTLEQLKEKICLFRYFLNEGKQVAFVIEKGALLYEKEHVYCNENSMKREYAIQRVAAYAKDDIIVSTTGKASRELFECREFYGEGHEKDFLTVGSMGHSSSIALGIALHKKNKNVWCIDGDGALLMHMGALAVIGNMQPSNYRHIVINNGAHESVGGFPTAANHIDISAVAKSCGYQEVMRVFTKEDLERALLEASNSRCLCMIEILCSIGARNDLGRPTTTPIDNKERFMSYLNK